MGNKFKLSDMIPNAWFYKLRDMSKNNRYNKSKKPHATSSSSSSLSNSSSLFSSSVSTNSNSSSIPPKIKQPQISHHRQSYYFTRDLSHESPQSPVLETKLPNSPIKSPKQRIGNRGNRESIEKLESSILISSDSENSFSIRNFKSFDSKFDVFGPIKEIESPNSPIRGRLSRVESEKRNSLSPISSDFGNSFRNTNIVSVDDNFDVFDPISKTKLPNSPSRSPKRRIRNRVCNKPNSQIPFSSHPENSVFESNVQNLDINFGGFYPISKTELPPIITKKKTGAKNEKKVSAPRKQRGTPVLRHSVNSTGVRLRSNSPRIGKVNESGRKSFSSGGRRRLRESLAVVKSSSDPQKDFRESMVEMILHNKIDGSKELEDLLACYLQLNCDEYHEMIINVFKQIWFELNNVGA